VRSTAGHPNDNVVAIRDISIFIRQLTSAACRQNKEIGVKFFGLCGEDATVDSGSGISRLSLPLSPPLNVCLLFGLRFGRIFAGLRPQDVSLRRRLSVRRKRRSSLSVHVSVCHTQTLPIFHSVFHPSADTTVRRLLVTTRTPFAVNYPLFCVSF
jgi:hypothetical protein